jgi:peptidylprolyl isomerase
LEIYRAMKSYSLLLLAAALAVAASAQTTPSSTPTNPQPAKTAATKSSASATQSAGAGKGAASTTKAATSTAAAKPTTTASTVPPWIKLPPGIPKVAHGPVKVPFAVHYEDIKVGAGAEGEPGKIWHIKYTGWRTADGVKFDSWDDHPQPVIGKDGKPELGPDGKPKPPEPQPMLFPQGTGRVIPGFDTGLIGMKIGGKRRIFIPWQLAYGIRSIPDRPDHPGIPAKSDLIFDVELVDVTDMQQPHPMMPGVPPHPGANPSPHGAPGASAAPGAKPGAPAQPATTEKPAGSSPTSQSATPPPASAPAQSTTPPPATSNPTSPAPPTHVEAQPH